VEARNDLESTLTDLAEDLADLVQSVRVIEQDPYRYGVELDEVERRRKLVEEVGGELEDMREELKKKIYDNKGKGVANGHGSLPDPDSFAEPDDYAAFEQERQMELLTEQDEALDGVFQTVGSLRQQADAMGQELVEQHTMLEDVETITDRVGGKLQVGMKKIGWVIKKNEGPSGLFYSNSCNALTTLQRPCLAAASVSSLSSSSFFWSLFW
jgi:t-SNARE syntaxin family protein